MATGDISNNIRKMRSKLKELKYSGDLDVNALAEGQPTAYLPIYHYAFTNYSAAIAQVILDKGIELFGKSDARFMEAVYKILRDIFAYKPPITKEQFFAKGFAERKVIMCTEILQHIKKKNMELNPAPSKTAMKASVRPKSAPETKNLLHAVPKTKRSGGPRSPRELDGAGPLCAPQVVNELTALPDNEPVRHLSTSASHIHPVRHIAGIESLNSSATSSTSESLLYKPASILSQHASVTKTQGKPMRHVSIQSPRDTERSPPTHAIPTKVWTFEDTPGKSTGLRGEYANPYQTPSIRKVCAKSVEVVCMPKGQYDMEKEPSILEIQAPTSDSVLHAPVPTSHIDISSLYHTVEKLGDQVKELALSQQAAGNYGNDGGKMDEALSKIENLTARILLLENRVSIVEAKMGEVAINPPPPVNKSSRTTFSVNEGSDKLQTFDRMREETGVINHTLEQVDISVDSPGLFQGPGNSFAEELKAMSSLQKSHLKANGDFSLNFSPIRQVANGVTGKTMSANEETFAMETEDDARRASTPTFGGSTLGENSFNCDISHAETKDAVNRIKDMIKETTQMIKDKPVLDNTS